MNRNGRDGSEDWDDEPVYISSLHENSSGQQCVTRTYLVLCHGIFDARADETEFHMSATPRDEDLICNLMLLGLETTRTNDLEQLSKSI